MSRPFKRSSHHGVPPRGAHVRRRRALVLAMLAALLGVVVLGRE
ncbi:hypothetical protein [Amnibacterium kyonggiense]|nr:hypothetical protein [Amnibacterium kyonggiense]